MFHFQNIHTLSCVTGRSDEMSNFGFIVMYIFVILLRPNRPVMIYSLTKGPLSASQTRWAVTKEAERGNIDVVSKAGDSSEQVKKKIVGFEGQLSDI